MRIFITRQADMAQLVEHNLAKVGVAGSSPVVRSIVYSARFLIGLFYTATWPSGKAEACKAFITGSIPVVASINFKKGLLRESFFITKLCSHIKMGPYPIAESH